MFSRRTRQHEFVSSEEEEEEEEEQYLSRKWLIASRKSPESSDSNAPRSVCRASSSASSSAPSPYARSYAPSSSFTSSFVRHASTRPMHSSSVPQPLHAL